MADTQQIITVVQIFLAVSSVQSVTAIVAALNQKYTAQKKKIMLRLLMAKRHIQEISCNVIVIDRQIYRQKGSKEKNEERLLGYPGRLFIIYAMNCALSSERPDQIFWIPLSVERQLAITLYYLSDEGHYQKNANAFRIARSTVSTTFRWTPFVITNMLGAKYIIYLKQVQMCNKAFQSSTQPLDFLSVSELSITVIST